MHAQTLTTREPGDPGNALVGRRPGPVREGTGRTLNMHVFRESDDSIVPEKRANKAGPKAAAELVEGRGSTKGNATRTLLVPDTVPGRRGIGLWGIQEAAKPIVIPEVRAV